MFPLSFGEALTMTQPGGQEEQERGLGVPPSLHESPKSAYQVLNDNPDEIRLIRIKRRPENPLNVAEQSRVDITKCFLEQHQLGNLPPYAAISYAWDQSPVSEPVDINGVIWQVSKNVGDILRHLQPIDEDAQDVLVWIDQICINQDDVLEKTHQVKIMCEIYTRASIVIAWLGLSEDNSGLLFDHLRTTSEHLSKDDLGPVMKSHSDKDFLGVISKAYRSFCERRYWTRVWVIQEFGVAPDVTLMCGKDSITYAQLRQVLFFLWKMPKTWPEIEGMSNLEVLITAVEMLRAYKSPASSFMEGILSTRRRYQLQHNRARGNVVAVSSVGTTLPKDESLLSVLVGSLVLEVDDNQPQATVPSDRIFGLLNLADDTKDFPHFPDYSRDCEDIYQEAARRMLMQGHIDVLSYCQFPREMPMATWAPDWRMKIRKPCVLNPWRSNFTASGNTLNKQQIKTPDDNTIILRGVAVDTVMEVGNTWDPEWLKPFDSVRGLAYIAEVQDFCTKSSRYETTKSGDVSIDAMRIAIADQYNYTTPDIQPELVEGYQEANNYMKMEIAGEPDAKYHVVTPFEDSLGLQKPWYMTCMTHLHSRRVIISKTGYVGLAPMHVEPGDQIVIFLGGKAAYCIREKSYSDFELVGEAFVHGLMYGEFIDEKSPIEEFTLR
jgi:hypothetical protein